MNPPLGEAGLQQAITSLDTVRVRATEETRAAGLAGLAGTMYGVTVPVKSGQGVLLTPPIGQGMGVRFEELDRTIFLPPDVLELADHGPGRTQRLETMQGWRSWVRLESGEWREVGEPAARRVSNSAPDQHEPPASPTERLLRFIGLKR